MKKIFTSRTLFAFLIVSVIFFVAACRGPAPTSTPVPPTANVPTALPPAPTAPPLTAAPTDVPPPTAVLPSATAVPPTNAPAATAVVPTTAPTSSSGVATPIKPPTRAASNLPPANVDRGPLTGLYISALRFEPGYPRRNDPIKFYATLINNSGKEQYYPVCAEIFRPDAKKSFGITNCDNLTIAIGTSEVFIGSWIATGIKECIPARARAVLREQGEGEVRLVFTTLNGGELWKDFQVCP